MVIEALKGHDYVVESHTADALGMKGVPLAKMDVDILITIGGDGTILRTLQASDHPVLGVNAGVLGFLTEVKPEEIKQAIRKLLAGRYYLDERLKLKTLDRKSGV
jgi:NAD+ kinase